MTHWNWLRSRSTNNANKRIRRRRRCRARLTFETLEDRVVLTAGFLDPAFGTNGLVLTDFAGTTENALGTFGLALQADGKILAAGQTTSGGGGSNFGLVRYDSDGTLDNSFSFDGKVATDFAGGFDFANAVAVQPDGKIVVVGGAVNGSNSDYALARYNPDGTLDTSFGSGGIVLTDFAGGDDYANSVVIQADGKIVVAGEASNGVGDDFGVARYNADGTPDADFSADGKLLTDFGSDFEFGFSVALQADGKIVVGGSAGFGADRDFAVARYHIDGTLDAGFASGGTERTDLFGDNDVARSVAIQADGGIVLAGSAFNGTTNDFALARYRPDGSLDPDFDADGKVATDLAGGSDLGRAVTIQTDGKIVVAGQSSSGGGGTNFALVRYNPDGTVDTSFNVDGKVLTDFAGGDDRAYAVAVQADGKIVAAGAGFNGTDSDFALARYLGDAPPVLPAVESVVINDGSAQRSTITSLTVTFSGVVNLDPGAFELLHVGVGLVGLQVDISTISSQTVAVLTFVGPDIVGGSLADGDYQLTIRGDQIADGLGQQLDGDADGTAGGDYVDEFFRLFGDADGDGDTDAVDRDLFRAAYHSSEGDPAYVAYFDYDGDGDIAQGDRKEFNKNYSK